MNYEPASLRLSGGLESGSLPANRFATVSYGQRSGEVAQTESGEAAPQRIGRLLPGLEQTLGQPRGPFGIKKRIGTTDDRQPVTSVTQQPYSGILMLHYVTPNGETLQGTAWLVGPQVAITAGHVVWDRNRGNNWSKLGHMRAYQGVNGTTSGAQSATVVGMNTTAGWQSQGQADCDFGVIYLDKSLSGHYFKFAEFKESDLEMMNVNVVGYPIDKPLKMMQHVGQIFDAQATLLYYQMDTEGGQSGCPLIYWSAAGEYRVVGIHSGAGVGQYNQGVRIADGVFDTLQSWM